MKNKNIIYLLIAAFFMLSQNGWSQNGDNEFLIPLSNTGKRGKLEVDIHRGMVTVTGTSRQDVLVKYERTDSETRSLEDAGNGLKRIRGAGTVGLEISERNNEVSVDTEHNSKLSHIIVEVPTNFDLEISTHHNGDVTINNINGEIVVDTHHGGMTAKGISGSVVADSWHGDLIVEYTSMTSDKAQAFTTYHGDIDLTMPSNSKANLKLKSSRGEILTGFDVSLTKQENKARTRDKNGTYKITLDEWVTGTINGGGAELMANTRGDIYLRKG